MPNKEIGHPAFIPHASSEDEEDCPRCAEGGKTVALVRLKPDASLWVDGTDDPSLVAQKICVACGFAQR